jgi:hypothetical protein
MKISYRTLAALIERLSDPQKDADVTVDVFDGQSFSSFFAEFRIVNELHDNLEKGHPVISVNLIEDIGPKVNDVDWLAKAIGVDQSADNNINGKEEANEPKQS